MLFLLSILNNSIADENNPTITYTNFDTVDVNAELVKPGIEYVSEFSHHDPCEKYKGTEEYIECSLNLSYENINELCELIQTKPKEVKKYLTMISKVSLQETVYETTGSSGWQYRLKNLDNLDYEIVSAPKRKFIGKTVSYDDRPDAWNAINSLHTTQIEQRLFNTPSVQLGLYHVSTWSACMTNGVDSYKKIEGGYGFVINNNTDNSSIGWHNEKSEEFNTSHVFVALPSIVGVCKDGMSNRYWTIGGESNFCSAFKGEVEAQSTIFNSKNNHKTHYAEGWISFLEPITYSVSKDFEEGTYILYPISSTMVVYGDPYSNTFGIFYRKANRSVERDQFTARMILDEHFASKTLLDHWNSSQTKSNKRTIKKNKKSSISSIMENESLPF